jgi:hypothetical protein
MPSEPTVLVEYDDFRTGLTFGEVRRMLWSSNPDPTTWKYKRRHTVLGVWRSLKLAMYDEYLARNEVPFDTENT